MVRQKVLDLPPEVRAFFSAASARRQRVDKQCEACGAPLRAVIRKRRYCNNACAQRAWRQRHQRNGRPTLTRATEPP